MYVQGDSDDKTMAPRGQKGEDGGGQTSVVDRG